MTRDVLSEAGLVIARRHATFGYGELQAGMSIDRPRARGIVRGWIADGLCVDHGRGFKKRSVFALTAAGRGEGVPETHGKTAEDQLWTAMRGLKQAFSPTQLSGHCAIPVTVEEARAYCRFLLAAGYLSVARKAIPDRSEAFYRLVRNTGPLGPRKRRVEAVADPNAGTLKLLGGAA